MVVVCGMFFNVNTIVVVYDIQTCPYVGGCQSQCTRDSYS